MSDSWVGRALGRYQIEAEIGRGGMGVVYRGRQTSLNRTVAIKVLPPQLAADPTFRQRFRQEAEVIASLTHENIVAVYDIEEFEGTVFIVMELIDGASARAVRHARPMTADEVRTIGISVARALTCAHQRGIVHRDVKSPNVMLTRDGKVKLMDFGIARVVGGGVRTVTGSVLGTPEYMAPEQARSGAVTPQTDLYSLGVVLYELATGQLPFSGGDAFAVALKHISEEPPTPRTIDPRVPEWLERIILKAMAKDPQRRYTSAAELERDLLAAGLATSPADAPTVASAVPLVPAEIPVMQSAAVLPTPHAPLPSRPVAAAPAPSVPTAATRVRKPLSLVWILVAAAAVVVVGVGITALMIARSGLTLPKRTARETSSPPVPTLPLEERSSPAHAEAGREASLPAEPELEKPVVVTPTRTPPVAAAAPPPAAPAAAPARVEAPALREAEPEAPARPERERPQREPPAPSPPVLGLFRCSETVEFHVSPEDAIVSVAGRRLGKADDLDGMGGNDGWQPSPGSYLACFEYPGVSSACVRIVVDRNAADDTCDVDTDLEDL